MGGIVEQYNNRLFRGVSEVVFKMRLKEDKGAPVWFHQLSFQLFILPEVHLRVLG